MSSVELEKATHKIQKTLRKVLRVQSYKTEDTETSAWHFYLALALAILSALALSPNPLAIKFITAVGKLVSTYPCSKEQEDTSE